MRLNQRTMVWLVVILVAIGASTLIAPHAVAWFTYATETGKATAAREQLKHATGFSHAFQHVAKAVRPSVVNISSTKRIQPIERGQVPGAVITKAHEVPAESQKVRIGRHVVIAEDQRLGPTEHVS